MGILDEAIREHLELKRKRGAEQGELRQLEDEAFGPPARPGTEEHEAAPSERAEASEPVEAETDLETQPEATDVSPEESAAAEPVAQTELPPEPPESAEGPAETAPLDREAIAQQPTEIFDVEGELAREAEEAAEAEEAEAAIEGPEDEADESPDLEAHSSEQDTAEPEAEAEIFDEESLSEELDRALEGPVETEPRHAAFFEETDEFQAPTQRPRRQTDDDVADTSEEDEDVLEETPEFLEETPEHDRLWFEQKPPKDFDFND